MRRVLPLLVAACAAAPVWAASPAKPGIWGRYLLGSSACVAPGVACEEQLAQSADGVRWTAVVGFSPRPGTAPVPLRRGSRLYVFDGTSLRRFSVRTRSVTELAPTTITLDSAAPPPWTDLLLDSGKIVLVYAVPLDTGELAVRTATEVAGSDGAIFLTDRGDRILLDASSGRVSMVRSRSGWVGVLADGTCLRTLTAGNLRGTYRDAGCLTTPSPVSSPSGYWNAGLREFWLYGVTTQGVARAAARKLTAPLAAARFRPLRPLNPGQATIGFARFASG